MSTKPDANRKAANWQSSLKDASPYLGLGMQLAFSMAFFTVGGYLIDQMLDTLPWLTILGGVLGMTAVFVQLIRVSQEMGRKERQRRDSAHK